MALNFVTFNQDNTLLGVGTTKGFRLFTTDPFSKYYENEEGDVSILEMLFSTSLVAMVLSPRLLRILNIKRNTTICELTFPMKILAVKMNRKRLAVVLEESIYLYDISNMKLLQNIVTSPNPHALCVLSPHAENNYMAYPQPTKQSTSTYQPAHAPPTGSLVAPSSGEVLIYDALNMESLNVIEAHQSSLGCLSMNSTGSMLATASEKGTIIRVFSIPDGQRLFHFRRGTLPAQIYCMTFNATSSLLCVSSATETVHIFKLVAQQSPFKPPASSSPPKSPTEPSSPSRSRGHKDDDDEDREQDDYEPPSSPSAATASETLGPSAMRTAAGLASILRRTSQTAALSLAQRVGGYLPASVTEMWEPARDFAWVRVPRLSGPPGNLSSSPRRDRRGSAAGSPGVGSSSASTATGQSAGPGASGGGGAVTGVPVKSVVAMSASHPWLMVVTSEGQFLVWRVDLERGGEAVLEKEARYVSESFWW